MGSLLKILRIIIKYKNSSIGFLLLFIFFVFNLIEVISPINSFFINNLNIVFFDFDLAKLFIDAISTYWYGLFGVLIAAYIPALISLYGDSASKTKLLKYYFSEAFSSRSIIWFFTSLVFSFWSKNYVFLSFVSIIAIAEIYYLYRVYYYSLIKRNTLLFSEYLKNIIEDSKKSFLDFKKVVGKIENAISAYDNSLAGEEDVEFNKIEFSSDYYIIDCNYNKLKKWIKYIIEEIGNKNGLATKKYGLFSSLKKESVSYKIKLTKNYDLKMVSFEIYYNKTEPSIQKLDIYRKHIDSFRKFFLYNTFTVEVLNYFDNYDEYIFDLCSQNKFLQVFEELDTLEKVLLFDRDKNSFELYNKVLDSLMKIYSKYPELAKTKSLKIKLYNLWETLLYSASKFNNLQFISDIFYTLYFALINGYITPDEFSNDVERSLTSSFKHSGFDPDYVFKFTKTLANIGSEYVKKDEKDRVKDIVKFIYNIKIDFINSFERKKITDLNRKAERFIDEGLFLFLGFINNKGLKDLFNELNYVINRKNILVTVQELLNGGLEKWHYTAWDRPEFDRRGFSGVKSYSPYHFVKSTLIEYFKTIKKLECIKNQSINISNINFFDELYNELDKSGLFESELSILKQIIDDSKNNKDNAIINSTINIDKIKKYFQYIYEDFLNEPKLSSCFVKKYIPETKKELAKGFYITIPKEPLSNEFDISLSDLSDLGMSLARGENNEILETISKTINIEEKTYNEFFNIIIDSYFEKGVTIFCKDKGTFIWNVFKHKEECLYNKKIKLKSMYNDQNERYTIVHDDYKKSNIELFIVRGEEANNDEKTTLIICEPKKLGKVNYYNIFDLSEKNLYKYNNQVECKYIDYKNSPSLTEEILEKDIFMSEESDKAKRERELHKTIGVQIYIASEMEINSNHGILKAYNLVK